MRYIDDDTKLNPPGIRTGRLRLEQKLVTPHAVYRLYGAKDELFYVGCSLDPFGHRLRDHSHKFWKQLIVKALITWYPGWAEAANAEAEAIFAEHPQFNVDRPTPPSCRLNNRPARLKGDGAHCPKCGTLIENKRPGKAYCNVCTREYGRARRLKLALTTP